MQASAVLTGPPVSSIDELPDRLVAIDQVLPPADGLACFNRMYRLVTESVKQHVGTGFFADPGWMAQLDVVFGNLYLDAVRDSVVQPDQVPRAWAALLDRRADTVLAQVEPTIRQSFSDAVLLSADRAIPGVQGVAANFDMVKARETAWANATTLWALNQFSSAREAEFLDGLDHLVGFAGRGLLVPVLF